MSTNQYFNVINSGDGTLTKVGNYFWQGRYQISLTSNHMSLYDNKKSKHVDMSVDDMRELMDTTKEMVDVQFPRLVQKEQVIPVANLNDNDVNKS